MRDYYTDNGNLFARIFSNRDLPNFVRDSVESEKTAAIHDSGFADEVNRLLPIHTAADTYISAAYFAKQAYVPTPPPPILDQIAALPADASSVMAEHAMHSPLSPVVGGFDKGPGRTPLSMGGDLTNGIPEHGVPGKRPAIPLQGIPAITPNLTTPNTTPIHLKSANDEITARILKAADLYGIRAEVDEVMAYAGSLQEKVAELEAPKVAEFEFESGLVGMAKIRGCGPDAVQKAAEFVLENYRSMPAASIQKAAAVLIEAAAENGTVVEEVFGKLAGPFGSMMKNPLMGGLGAAGAWAADKLSGGQQSSAPISGAGFASMLPSDFQRPSSSRFGGIGQSIGAPAPAPAPAPAVTPNIPTIKSLPSPNPAPLNLKGVPRSDAMTNAISHFGAADQNMTTPPAPTPERAALQKQLYSGPHAKRGSFRSDPDHIAQQKAIRVGAIQDSLERKTAAEEITGISDAVALESFDQKYKIAGRYSGNLDHPCLVFHTLPPAAPELSLEEKLAYDLTINGASGVACQAIIASLGEQKIANMIEAGGVSLTEAEASLLLPYLAGQI